MMDRDEEPTYDCNLIFYQPICFQVVNPMWKLPLDVFPSIHATLKENYCNYRLFMCLILVKI